MKVKHLFLVLVVMVISSIALFRCGKASDVSTSSSLSGTVNSGKF